MSAAGAFWANKQLEEAKEQFEVSGPRLEFSSRIQFVHGESGKQDVWLDSGKAPKVTDELLARYKQIWLAVKVTNTGRSDTALSSARFQQGENSWLNHTTDKAAFYCTLHKGDIVRCKDCLPVTLGPGWSYYIYFPLKNLRDGMKNPEQGKGRDVVVEIGATGLRSPTTTVAAGIFMTLS
ncbi:hypothetical protein [Amycolatopsis sp. cmx-4-54]|uniref:hypothetical protein n=1 Tax=Amycolatopsis sp. cmx-4-54 TaxID=2790936 RepID=UPI003979D081